MKQALWIGASASVLTMATATMPALAQEDVPNTGMDTIIVTAPRRAQDIQNVPLAIEVLTADDIDAIAATDMMAEMCIGKTVEEATKITNLDVEHALRDTEDTAAVPPQKMHCSVMAYEVIKRAASIYRNVDISTLEEKDIVCECARVTLQTVEDAIRINDLTTVEEITDYTKAGAFCKSCIEPGGHEKRKYYLVDILERVRGDMAREQNPDQEQGDDFASLSVVKKIKAIEKVLDTDIRPVLARDGGGIELDDLECSDGGTCVIFVQYKGACKGCAGSVAGTLGFVQQTLQDKLSPYIQVKVA